MNFSVYVSSSIMFFSQDIGPVVELLGPIQILDKITALLIQFKL